MKIVVPPDLLEELVAEGFLRADLETRPDSGLYWWIAVAELDSMTVFNEETLRRARRRILEDPPSYVIPEGPIVRVAEHDWADLRSWGEQRATPFLPKLILPIVTP